MNEMSSFYGGRAGSSFIIVQRFDGIDIPQPNDGVSENVLEYTYTENAFAVDEHDVFILTTKANGGNYAINENADVWLIERNVKNNSDYHWKRHPLDGSAINSTSYNFPRVLAKGMVQCFAQGAKSTNLVNYGEYVLIDTMLNMKSTNNPDNGKVFRRGMDVQSDLAGAEYIGQIVGPQGDTAEIDITTYEEVLGENPHTEKAYNIFNGGLIAGSKKEQGVRTYEDEIKYAYATIRDVHGNIEGCLIGFRFPTLVQDFEANSISPYENRVIGTSGLESRYTDLITEDTSQYINNQWQHPFYQKWKVSIPQGYHGIDSENIEIVHSYTQPPEYHKKGKVRVYNTFDCNDNDFYKDITEKGKKYRILGTEYKYIDDSSLEKIYGKYYIEKGSEYNANPNIISVKIFIDDSYKYVKKEDCYMDIIRYKENDYDNIKNGEVRYFYIGDYNTVERVAIADDGTLTVFYSANPQPKELEEVLRWIDTKNSKGITIDDDGTVHIYYNTTHEPDSSDPHQVLDSKGRAHDHQDYPTLIDWITNVMLTPEGKFSVLYNNNTVKIGVDSDGQPIRGNRYETTLQWINYVDFAYDGTVTFRWNTDLTRTETPAYQFSNQIRFLHDVNIENTKTDAGNPRLNGYEGTGDQKVHIKYNNDGHIDRPLGEPLNYIIETCISKPSATYPNAPYSHLLVYYADPALRLKLKDKWVRYPSTKIIDRYIPDPDDPSGVKQLPIYHIWDEWVDLGNVRGVAGGIHTIKNVATLNDLKDTQGNFIPPEKLTNSSGDIINPEGAGWGCTMDSTSSAGKEILFYDYQIKQWYSIGSIDSSMIDPSYIIVQDMTDEHQMPKETEAAKVKTNGFWLAQETMLYAN